MKLIPSAIKGKDDPSLRKVLVVSPQPFFEERGTPIAVRDVCLALVELGFGVDLLTLPVGSPVSIPGVNIIRVENPFGVDSIPIGFSKHKLVFGLLIWRKLRDLVKQNNYYRIHAVEEAVFLAQMTPRIRKEAVIYDMASSLAQHFKPGLVNAALSKLESTTLRRIGYVICSAGLGSRVQPHRAAASSAPGFHEWWFPPPPLAGRPIPASTLRRALGFGEVHQVLLYAGSLAKYQGFQAVLDSIPQVLEKRKQARYVIIGGSEEESSALQASIPSRFLDRVRIVSKLPRAIVADFYDMADILLSPRAETDNVPLKIFEYLAAGKAVVASDVTGHRAILDEEICAFFGGDGDSLGEVLIRLMGNPAECERLAEASAKFAATHISWDLFRSGINRAYPIGAKNMVSLELSSRAECLNAAEHRLADAARARFLEMCEKRGWSSTLTSEAYRPGQVEPGELQKNQ